VEAISETNAEVLLVDGIDSVETMMRELQHTSKPLLFNQIAGGKSPKLSITELNKLGVRMVQYSTPMLFAAHLAMDQALQTLLDNGGLISYDPSSDDIGVTKCTAFLEAAMSNPSEQTLVDSDIS
jgi:2-methylisocitrate lyase-like PEP mutase family enzyme